MNGRGKTLIIGAGPAGITCAYELANRGRASLIIEKEPVAGGLAKTLEYKGFRFDIGPHRFFTKSKHIEKVWKTILGEDFILCRRRTRIYFRHRFFLYPIKILDALTKIGIVESIVILYDYLKTQLLYRNKQDADFHDWVINRFGRKLFEMFFKAYTEKIWGLSCREISSEWAAQRIKGVSLFFIVKSAFLGNRGGKIKSIIGQFYYPKYGAGQMYEEILGRAVKKGTAVQFHTQPQAIEIINKRADSVYLKDKEGRLDKVEVDYLVSSMPFSEIFKLLSPAAPKYILDAAAGLKYRALIEVCLIVKGKTDFPDQWIYIHDSKIVAGRAQIYKNWSSYMSVDAENFTHLGMEYFCFRDDDFWMKEDREIIRIAGEEFVKLKMFREKAEVVDGFVVRVPYAYPVYSGSYKDDLGLLREYIDKIENLQVIGRCGMYRYNNMDHSMLTGIYAAQNIMEGRKKYNIWEVNEEKEYLEE